jgi:hypothetical protein
MSALHTTSATASLLLSSSIIPFIAGEAGGKAPPLNEPRGPGAGEVADDWERPRIELSQALGLSVAAAADEEAADTEVVKMGLMAGEEAAEGEGLDGMIVAERPRVMLGTAEAEPADGVLGGDNASAGLPAVEAAGPRAAAGAAAGEGLENAASLPFTPPVPLALIPENRQDRVSRQTTKSLMHTVVVRVASVPQDLKFGGGQVLG